MKYFPKYRRILKVKLVELFEKAFLKMWYVSFKHCFAGLLKELGFIALKKKS